MPTQQRPFFANFMAAFRAHSSSSFNPKPNSSPSGSTSPGPNVASGTHVTTTTATVANSPPSHSSNTASNPRTISTKATAFQQSPNQPITSQVIDSASPNTNAASLSRSPANTAAHYVNMSISPPGATTPLSRGRQRRGSDSSSSSGGFKDILGPEKWYIGGRTASGDEKFYRLGLVTTGGIGGSGRRVPSLDRLSL